MNEGLAGGALLVVLGIFVVSRTIIHDSNGNNLVDRLLGVAGNSSTSPGGTVLSKTGGGATALKRDPKAGKVTPTLQWPTSPQAIGKDFLQLAEHGQLP